MSTSLSVAGACARTATLEQRARIPGAAVLTGRATGVIPGGYDVAFAVDRWFIGPHAARTITLLGSSAIMSEPPEAGLIRARLAFVVSGEAITLIRDQPVLLVAVWEEASGAFASQGCSIGAVPLDTAEGRAQLDAAIALLGEGRAGAVLPETDTALAVGPSDGGATGLPPSPPMPLVVTALVGAAAILRRLVRSSAARA